jgi:hypothetical protein
MSWLAEHEFPELHDSIWNLQHAESPLTVLRAISDLQGFGQVITTAAVQDARDQGISWQEIADALRLSRQAVHRRYAAGEPDEQQ